MGYKIEYSDDKVSACGRFSVMKNINDKIGLRTILRDLPIPESTSNNRYEKEDLIESFLLSVWLAAINFQGLLRADSGFASDALFKHLEHPILWLSIPLSYFLHESTITSNSNLVTIQRKR